jgi:plasmid stabilization system protein ParE
LRAITAYIARDDPAAALRFTQRLLDDAQALKRASQRGAQVRQRPGVRRIVHRSYLIYYHVEEAPNIIRVLRFWRGARDPKTLRLDG